MSKRISFTGLHVISGTTNERSWFIDGDFSFEDDADFDEFKSGIEGAFEFVKGYHVPTVLTPTEYSQMHELPKSLEEIFGTD